MSFKRIAVLFARILALTLIGIITMIVSSAITPQPEIIKLAATSDSSQSMIMMILVRFILAIIFAFILEKTCQRGFRLMGLLVWVVFGITTFMTQIETLIFGSAFPMLSVNDVFLLVYTSLVETLIFVPLAVLIMGKWKSNGQAKESLFHNSYLVPGAILAVIYPVLYFFFGYFVAWQSSAVREFYATTTITTAQPLLTFIQIGRGFLWVIVGLPLLVLFEKRTDKIIASVLCYGLFPSIGLLYPNPLMPEPVRMAHFVEVTISMAIFGLLFGLLMTKKEPVTE
ncbi:MAG TPA: hypothetical protein VF338_06715 [Leptolinea sp.]